MSELVDELLRIAEADDAKAVLLIKWRLPNGKVDWTPFESTVTLADKLREAAAALSEAEAREAHADKIDEEQSAKIVELSNALSSADETEAARERPRDLVTERYRVVANALSRPEAELELAVKQLFCAAAQRDALALALTQIQDHWPVSGELESYRLQQDMRASESMRNIAKRALAAAADIQDDKETT